MKTGLDDVIPLEVYGHYDMEKGNSWIDED